MKRLTFEGNFCDIAMCNGEYRMTTACADGPCSQRQVWERLKMYEDREEQRPQQIPYEERRKVYTEALVAFGDFMQMVVAVEEMAECIQAICKILRGGENFDHMAEETADATSCWNRCDCCSTTTKRFASTWMPRCGDCKNV